MTRLSMRFDLRVPPFAQTSFADQHQAMLEMVTWADDVGVETVILSEHHGDPAGFTSAPITLAAAVLAVFLGRIFDSPPELVSIARIVVVLGGINVAVSMSATFSSC